MKTNFVLALLAMLAFLSCKKNDTQNNNTDPTTRLQRYIVFDGQDTVAKYRFNYDSQSRIAETHRSFYEDGTPSYDNIATFYYNGNDSVQSRIQYHYIDLSNGHPDEIYSEYFTYDASGRLITDTIATQIFPLGYHFNYFSDHFTLTMNFGDTVTTQQIISNGNLLNENDMIVGAFIQPFSVDIQNTFDNHPNPFYNAEIRRVLHYMPENFLQDEELPSFRNNPVSTSSIKTGSNPRNEQRSYSYTYNADGYPVTAVINDQPSGDQFTAKYFY